MSPLDLPGTPSAIKDCWGLDTSTSRIEGTESGESPALLRTLSTYPCRYPVLKLPL